MHGRSSQPKYETKPGACSATIPKRGISLGCTPKSLRTGGRSPPCWRRCPALPVGPDEISRGGSMTHLMEVKCPRCGRVHMRVSPAHAKVVIASANACLSPGDPPARYEDYLFCFGCRAPASTFVPA